MGKNTRTKPPSDISHEIYHLLQKQQDILDSMRRSMAGMEYQLKLLHASHRAQGQKIGMVLQQCEHALALQKSDGDDEL